MSVAFIGDTGTIISLDCGTDVSTASSRNIVARKPNGAKVTWPAVADTTTSIKYTTTSGDLDVAGVWKLQAVIVMPGWQGVGDIAHLTVAKPL